MHEGTPDTAHLLSEYREQHSGIFPASGKASCLATKCSHFLWKTATYIYETSMQIPCSIQFKFTFLSETKYRKFFSALYMFNWPWLHSTKEKTTNKTKQKPKKHTPLFWTYLFPPPAQHRPKKQLYRHRAWSERKQMGTVATKSLYCHQPKKFPTENKWKEIR